MKLNEVIELNGKEYTVELNRESILRIDKYTNLQESFKKITMSPYEDKSRDDLPSDEDPFKEVIDEEEIEKINNEKGKAILKVITRAFWIWLYPNHQLKLEEVGEILKPYFEEDEKSKYLEEKYQHFFEESTKVRLDYLEQQKNLKAQVK